MDGKRGSMNMLEVARHENSENEGAESCSCGTGWSCQTSGTRIRVQKRWHDRAKQHRYAVLNIYWVFLDGLLVTAFVEF